MTVIGLTGPTGSGKTTALHVLENMGFAVVDCDALYYERLKTDAALRGGIRDAFGNVFLPDGQLDRPALGKLVFGDKAAMERLNAIVFPAINAAVRERISAVKGRGIVIDAINLVESGLGALCDWTIAILAPPAVRIRRIMERDGIGEEYAKGRVAAQKSDGFYRKHCALVLENRAGSRREFEALIRAFFADFLEDMEV